MTKLFNLRMQHSAHLCLFIKLNNEQYCSDGHRKEINHWMGSINLDESIMYTDLFYPIESINHREWEIERERQRTQMNRDVVDAILSFNTDHDHLVTNNNNKNKSDGSNKHQHNTSTKSRHNPIKCQKDRYRIRCENFFLCFLPFNYHFTFFDRKQLSCLSLILLHNTIMSEKEQQWTLELFVIEFEAIFQRCLVSSHKWTSTCSMPIWLRFQSEEIDEHVLCLLPSHSVIRIAGRQTCRKKKKEEKKRKEIECSVDRTIW